MSSSNVNVKISCTNNFDLYIPIQTISRSYYLIEQIHKIITFNSTIVRIYDSDDDDDTNDIYKMLHLYVSCSSNVLNALLRDKFEIIGIVKPYVRETYELFKYNHKYKINKIITFIDFTNYEDDIDFLIFIKTIIRDKNVFKFLNKCSFDHWKQFLNYCIKNCGTIEPCLINDTLEYVPSCLYGINYRPSINHDYAEYIKSLLIGIVSACDNGYEEIVKNYINTSVINTMIQICKNKIKNFDIEPLLQLIFKLSDHYVINFRNLIF
jgi:hypothetical protein